MKLLQRALVQSAFLDKTSRDLFIYAKNLLVEAKAPQTQPPLKLMRASGNPRP